MVTAGTYNKRLFFRDTADSDFLQDRLLELAEEHGRRLEAWAVFANWFAENATPAFQKTVNSFPIDKVQVDDDFLADPSPQI